MELRAADQKALLFGAGGVRFALRLSQVREIVPVERDHADVVVRGIPVAAASLSVAFGLTTSRTPLAIVTEGSPFAFRIETVHGVVELASAEVFQLPAHTSLPQPSPFCGAIVTGGAVALELSLHAVGWSPIEPAIDFLPVPDGRASDAPAHGREIVFTRGSRAFAVPVQVLAHVVDAPRIFQVPLTPSAHRGLLYHGRALHPVFDLPALCGDAPSGPAAMALLIDAGGNAVATLADRIISPRDDRLDVSRPSWDTLFASA